jgi:hypothetical protein
MDVKRQWLLTTVRSVLLVRHRVAREVAAEKVVLEVQGENNPPTDSVEVEADPANLLKEI